MTGRYKWMYLDPPRHHPYSLWEIGRRKDDGYWVWFQSGQQTRFVPEEGIAMLTPLSQRLMRPRREI